LVYFDRCQPPSAVRLRLDGSSYHALRHSCARDASASEIEAAWARVKFVPAASVS
jgi:hypothetical protein